MPNRLPNPLSKLPDLPELPSLSDLPNPLPDSLTNPLPKPKYPILDEFYPLSLYTLTVSERYTKLANNLLNPQRAILKNPWIKVERRSIPGYQGEDICIIIMKPKDFEGPSPCYLDIHGGGFIYEATPAQYLHAANYAREIKCAVVFPQYRLAPEYPFPYPQEDTYATYVWLVEHAEELGIDANRIGVGGNSAGGTLAVTTAMMARDRGFGIMPNFTLLVYPFLDARNNSESCKRFTDTPVWNSTLSSQVIPIINPNPDDIPLGYSSPVEAETLAGMPPAYIEVAEYDCLHDDGILYDELLRREGIETELHETKGTMHGFDSMVRAPTTKNMVQTRMDYMRRIWELE